MPDRHAVVAQYRAGSRDISYLRIARWRDGAVAGTVAVAGGVVAAGSRSIEATGVSFLPGAGARAPLQPACTPSPKRFLAGEKGDPVSGAHFVLPAEAIAPLVAWLTA